jgi:hypothetical protein
VLEGLRTMRGSRVFSRSPQSIRDLLAASPLDNDAHWNARSRIGSCRASLGGRRLPSERLFPRRPPHAGRRRGRPGRPDAAFDAHSRRRTCHRMGRRRKGGRGRQAGLAPRGAAGGARPAQPALLRGLARWRLEGLRWPGGGRREVAPHRPSSRRQIPPSLARLDRRCRGEQGVPAPWANGAERRSRDSRDAEQHRYSLQLLPLSLQPRLARGRVGLAATRAQPRGLGCGLHDRPRRERRLPSAQQEEEVNASAAVRTRAGARAGAQSDADRPRRLRRRLGDG